MELETKPLLVVHVQVRVHPEHVAAFIAATRINARASRAEPSRESRASTSHKTAPTPPASC
jgi:hypothetical protein